MTTPTDDRGDNYLWDQSGPVDPAVADLERRLSPLAFDPSVRRLEMAPVPSHRARFVVLMGAIAASLLLLLGFWFYQWRLEWPADRAWKMIVTQASQAAAGQLAVGQSLAVTPPASAHIDVARLGTIDASPGTELTVSSTQSNRHRVEMTRGKVDVRLWAPPGVVAFHTPAGDVVDLGCTFTLTVDSQRLTFLTVQTGWVQLRNEHGESLIPAGASSLMQADRRPFVPVYDDASPEFLNAVRAYERADADAGQRQLQSVVMTKLLRPRDVLTLLLLAVRQQGSARADLVSAAASLTPPPSDVSLKAIVDGDNEAVWKWINSLAPPVKGWWLNWRDALPHFK